jgi:GntR family transcriptional regulator, transcriptional repressor for pyruvate dehydrogenase complex
MDPRPAVPNPVPLPEKVPVPRSAADRLRRMIEQRQLKAGDQLPPQRELADHLKVSRASLREALSALETLGLVSVQPGRGVYVLDPGARPAAWRFADRGSPGEAYEVRYCVESFAAEIAATRLDGAALAALHGTVSALREAFERHDVDGMAKADSAFHDLIIEACGNAILAAMYRSVREMLVESQKLPMLTSPRLESTVREHQDLLGALERRDPVRAGALMREHIRSAAERYGIALRSSRRLDPPG